MKVRQLNSLAVLFVVIVIPTVLACDGYMLKMKKIANCGNGADVLHLGEGVTSQLTDDCKVQPQGCITATQDIKQAIVSYDFVKDNIMPIKGSVDACKEMEKADEKTVQLVMTLVGIPPKCPIPAGERCANSSTVIDISEHKHMLAAAAGHYKGRIISDHGDNKASCVEIDAVLSK